MILNFRRVASLVAATAGLLVVSSFTRKDERVLGAQPEVSSKRDSQSESSGVAKVTDVAGDSLGRIYIADERLGVVHLFDRQLRPIGTVGRRGTKAGEYLDLQAVRIVNSHSFIVIDRYLRRLDTYEWSKSGPSLSASAKLPFEPYDICVLGRGKFLFVGLYKGRKLHVTDSLGNLLSSRAPMDKRYGPMAADHVVQGRVLCDGVRRIVLTSSWVPDVEVFGATGDSAEWKGRLSPIRTMTIEETPGKITFGSGPHGYHSPVRTVLLSGLYVFQAQIVARNDGIPDDSVLWYALDRERKGWEQAGGARSRVYPLWRDTALAISGTSEPHMRIVPLRTLSDLKVGR